MKHPFYKIDPWLQPYRNVLDSWCEHYRLKKDELRGTGTLADFASGHLYYGMHKIYNKLIFREWAPNALQIFLIGDFSNWDEKEEFELKRKNSEGDWELVMPLNRICHGDLYKLSIYWKGGSGHRIPSYAKYVIQDDSSKTFTCCHWMPDKEYNLKQRDFSSNNLNPLIYEAHIGMSSEDEKVSTFSEFRKEILPRIVTNGYNTLQLMAIQEHPYYGSFGYHVSNFFAVSSRFGTPDEFKELVDEAHGMGIAVIMDLVHSHSVSNTNEGLGLFDGDPGQYFHSGDRRVHKAWNSLCFDYGKNHVLHFLLSNCRYWVEEYSIDGFRFDGITSMIYYDHGLERNFTSYEMYFDGGQDIDALAYLYLANCMIHELKPGIITIAEEMSGMPGVACPIEQGGLGFDFRLAMGVPDYWIRLIKESSDEDWDMDAIFHELTQHRPEERTISYCESHDQALVGDKTIIFRLIDAEMYFNMNKGSTSMIVDRGIALHKMIRLITVATAQSGYLTFMGNEFGHPEWIDFPREGNNWSCKYARRQWSLTLNRDLRYHQLLDFDISMIHFIVEKGLLNDEAVHKIAAHNDNKVLVFRRGRYLLIFNFHPTSSFTDYAIPVKGKYRVVFDTDRPEFGGFDRIDSKMIHYSVQEGRRVTINTPFILKVYIPSRTSLILEELPVKKVTTSL
ncbi:MAG TPA: alpha amylase C-terminal domain-containing protein [Bacteroidales bacterium]|nr:alpha amylase C-terminal domain-containing protein [Bacteroidales bacterium]